MPCRQNVVSKRLQELYQHLHFSHLICFDYCWLLLEGEVAHHLTKVTSTELSGHRKCLEMRTV